MIHIKKKNEREIGMVSECLPTKPLHTAGPPEDDSPVHRPPADAATGAVCVRLHSLPISQNVLPSSHLHTHTSQVRRVNGLDIS